MFLNREKTDKCQYDESIVNIKKQLDLTDKYYRFTNFKQRVLEPAKKEINKLSNLNFKYEILKAGRFSEKIRFIISKKQEKTEKKIIYRAE
jgi:plasmid replication initiation protein